MPMGTKFFPPELEEPRLGDMEVIDSRVFVHTKAFRIQADAQFSSASPNSVHTMMDEDTASVCAGCTRHSHECAQGPVWAPPRRIPTLTMWSVDLFAGVERNTNRRTLPCALCVVPCAVQPQISLNPDPTISRSINTYPNTANSDDGFMSSQGSNGALVVWRRRWR